MSVIKGNDEVHFFYKKYYVESDAWDKNDIRKNAFTWIDLYNYAQSLDCTIKPGKYDYITVKTKIGNELNLCKVWNKINSNYSVEELMKLL